MGTGQRRVDGRAARVLAALVVLALVPSCTSSRGAEDSGGPQRASPTPAAAWAGTESAPPVVVVGPEPMGLPAACRPARVGAAIASLLAAINAGDAEAVDRLVSPEPEFQWYSVAGRPGERFDAAAESRTGLRGYLLDRHAHGERLRLHALRVNASDVRNGVLVGHFEYTLTRSADDLPAGKSVEYLGKGALNCWAGRVLVWSMGPDPDAGSYPPCPQPSQSPPPDGVIACARSGAT